MRPRAARRPQQGGRPVLWSCGCCGGAEGLLHLFIHSYIHIVSSGPTWWLCAGCRNCPHTPELLDLCQLLKGLKG